MGFNSALKGLIYIINHPHFRSLLRPSSGCYYTNTDKI